MEADQEPVPQDNAGEDPSFEEALVRLEEVVETLEDGQLSLDQSLKLFEEGVKLAHRCRQTLNEAEVRIEQVLAEADGTLETVPFELADES